MDTLHLTLDSAQLIQVQQDRRTTIPRSTILTVEEKGLSDENAEILGWGLILAAGLAVHLLLTALHIE